MSAQRSNVIKGLTENRLYLKHMSSCIQRFATTLSLGLDYSLFERGDFVIEHLNHCFECRLGLLGLLHLCLGLISYSLEFRLLCKGLC